MGRLCSAPLFPRSNTSNQVKVTVGVRPRDSLKGGEQFGVTVKVLMDGAEMASGMLAGGQLTTDAPQNGPTDAPKDETSEAPMEGSSKAPMDVTSEAPMDGSSQAPMNGSSEAPMGEFLHAGEFDRYTALL